MCYTGMENQFKNLLKITLISNTQKKFDPVKITPKKIIEYKHYQLHKFACMSLSISYLQYLNVVIAMYGSHITTTLKFNRISSSVRFR